MNKEEIGKLDVIMESFISGRNIVCADYVIYDENAHTFNCELFLDNNQKLRIDGTRRCRVYTVEVGRYDVSYPAWGFGCRPTYVDSRQLNIRSRMKQTVFEYFKERYFTNLGEPISGEDLIPIETFINECFRDGFKNLLMEVIDSTMSLRVHVRFDFDFIKFNSNLIGPGEHEVTISVWNPEIYQKYNVLSKHGDSMIERYLTSYFKDYITKLLSKSLDRLRNVQVG
jgi:hypothetical protein